MKLFISHINEESNLALTLKEWIESSFAGQCDVFVSSDKDDIPAGSKWIEAIDNALSEAVGLIVLCSPVSLARPWINFETGCGWIKRVPIIPICHSGQKKADLPPPISMFQALEIDEKGFISDLLSALAKHLKFSKIPRIDQNSMRRELLVAATTVKPDTVSATVRVTASTQDEIPQEAVDILKALAQVSGRRLTARELAGHFNMTEQRTQYFLDLLIENKVVYRALHTNSPATYSLSSEGRKYLFNQGLL